jgi:hypothetical protein
MTAGFDVSLARIQRPIELDPERVGQDNQTRQDKRGRTRGNPLPGVPPLR